jgi:hypothetical protein
MDRSTGPWSGVNPQLIGVEPGNLLSPLGKEPLRPVRLALLASLIAGAAPAQDRWEQANASVVRHPPSVFGELPPGIRQELEARRCRIPQTDVSDAPHNVVRGQFIQPGQFDYAVLCSLRDTSRILVFREGELARIDELDAQADREFLQTVTGGLIAFSRLLIVAEPVAIRRHHRSFGGPDLPALNHHGIETAFAGKASHIWYWHLGRWLLLQGAD